MPKRIKNALLIVLLAAFMGGGYFLAKSGERSLTFENHNPLRDGLEDKDFQALYAIHRGCFEDAKRKNLVRYFMKYENTDKVLAEMKAARVMTDSKQESEKGFANTINAFVARDKGELIGLFNCREEQPVTHGSMMVFNVCVRADKRGQGYGALLMSHALKHCSRPGKEITLTVYKDDTKVVDFYKTLEFKIISNLDEWDHQFPYFNKYLMQYQPQDAREHRQD